MILAPKHAARSAMGFAHSYPVCAAVASLAPTVMAKIQDYLQSLRHGVVYARVSSSSSTTRETPYQPSRPSMIDEEKTRHSALKADGFGRSLCVESAKQCPKSLSSTLPATGQLLWSRCGHDQTRRGAVAFHSDAPCIHCIHIHMIV